MNSTGLADWQVDKLFKRVQQELHFLDRLEGRMHQKHFPENDPLYDRVKKAREAVKELSIQLSQLMKILPR